MDGTVPPKEDKYLSDNTVSHPIRYCPSRFILVNCGVKTFNPFQMFSLRAANPRSRQPLRFHFISLMTFTELQRIPSSDNVHCNVKQTVPCIMRTNINLILIGLCIPGSAKCLTPPDQKHICLWGNHRTSTAASLTQSPSTSQLSSADRK
jgi:hypothetical protein